MTYEFYKMVHLIGLLLLVFGLFGLGAVGWNGSAVKAPLKRVLVVSHGIGLSLLLIAGFGMLARLGMMQSLPGWVYGKLVLWFALGGILSFLKRKPQKSKVGLVIVFILVMAAAYMVVQKPF